MPRNIISSPHQQLSSVSVLHQLKATVNLHAADYYRFRHALTATHNFLMLYSCNYNRGGWCSTCLMQYSGSKKNLDLPTPPPTRPRLHILCYQIYQTTSTWKCLDSSINWNLYRFQKFLFSVLCWWIAFFMKCLLHNHVDFFLLETIAFWFCLTAKP